MKDVINETKKQMMINSRTSEIEKNVMQQLFEEYQIRYGLDYLQVLSSEYEKYPELVLITPELLHRGNEYWSKSQTSDIRNVFIGNLNCNACVNGKPKDFYQIHS